MCPVTTNRSQDYFERSRRTPSGTKYSTALGFNAIKNGIKDQSQRINVLDQTPKTPKPPWLRVRMSHDPRFMEVAKTVRENNLATVCEESHCPNIGECWSHGTATIMLMGAVCTRACRFCAVDTGNPNGWIDPEEPNHAALAVKKMNLRYVVLTSVDRDDLPLGGAKHFADCVRAIREACPNTKIEALTPDFAGDLRAVETAIVDELDVFAHNVETVPRLSPRVRDPRAGYVQSLKVLSHAKSFGDITTKSSLMLGLGETDEEIRDTFDDIREARVDFLTLGQYLQPTRNHLPVEKWVTPEEFEQYREWGMEAGFIDVFSGPLVRSSYRADRLASDYINQLNKSFDQ